MVLDVLSSLLGLGVMPDSIFQDFAVYNNTACTGCFRHQPLSAVAASSGRPHLW